MHDPKDLAPSIASTRHDEYESVHVSTTALLTDVFQRRTASKIVLRRNVDSQALDHMW